MDLLAPCRSCLQCLPFFHDSPPPSPRHAAAAPSTIPESEEASSKAAPLDLSHNIEELQCPDAAPAMQEQDPPLIGKKEDAICEKSDGLPEDNTGTHLSAVLEDEATAMSGIIIAPPVSASEGAYLPANTKPNRTTVPSEFPMLVPFINDISFPTSGLLPLASPITPAAIGAGYPAGQYYHNPQIYQGPHDAHPHVHAHQGHNNSHYGHDQALHVEHVNLHHRHDNSHEGDAQGHDHLHHGHDQDHDHSQNGHAEDHGHPDFTPSDAVSHPRPPLDLSEFGHEHHKVPSRHDHSHHGPDQDQDHSHHGHTEDHGHTDFAPLDAVSYPHPPLDLSESVHELHKDPSCNDPHHHNTDGPSMDDAPPPLKCENLISENIYHDGNPPPHELAYDSAPLPPLETSQSTPVLEDNPPPHDLAYDSAPLPPLETSQSTPVLDVEANLPVENGGMDMASSTNGASAGLLQTFHSEPIAQLGTQDDGDHHDAHGEGLGHSVSHQGQRRRRRDQFKNQFKGISQQIKQGGHHIKEESSKHLQTIISNVNKQAQQIEQSGSFFNIPR